MALSFYNTLGRETRIFEPRTAGKVGFYGCGPTVYNYAHIGNLRAYVTHDILVRTLRSLGYEVCHVMNVTDVGHLSDDADHGDDKMVRSAEERGKTVLEIADFYTQAFFSDMEKLNNFRPSIVCKATDHVQDMIALIQRIEAAGFTYAAGGNLYFDVSKFPRYGDLALLRMDELKAGARIGLDENKRNAADFVLWFTKSKFENQALVWDSPWGRGYPGWHIECSAMSIKYLGEQFDIHAGGVDHIPIHHTNEIAQSEAATGKHPWVNYWLHNEFLVLGSAAERAPAGEDSPSAKVKMSKSSGQFLTLQNLTESGYDPLDYRYFLLGAHYRSQLQFSFEALTGARNARKSLLDRIKVLAEKAVAAGSLYAVSLAAGKAPKTEKYLTAFTKALEDDLNTPRALAEIWGLLRDNEMEPGAVLETSLKMDKILGLNLAEALRKEEKTADPALIAKIEALINERTEAKKAKNFARADEIRNQLKEQGIILLDSPGGTAWKQVQQ